MTARIASIFFSAILLPLIALAQTPAAEAEQALRGRATEFMQHHVDGNFRKAYDLVAEDTKESYFNSGKTQFQGFTITRVIVTDDSTKGTVTATVSKTMSVAGTDIPVTVPSTTTWKIENGKWVWYNDVKDSRSMPIGTAAALAASSAPAGAAGDGGLPKEINAQTIAASAKSILQQVGVDKNEITLAWDQPSEEQVILHNGMTGSVQVELSAPEVPGFTAKLEQSMVKPASDVRLVLRYEPAGQAAGRPAPFTVQLLVQPLNQAFAIRVNFAARGPAVR